MIPLHRKNICSFLIIMCFLLLSGDVVRAKEGEWRSDYNKTTPAHTYVEIKRVEQQIGALGLFMGKPESETLGIRVSNVAIHDVYFQARSLAMKANRLSFELIRQQKALQALPKGVIRPVEVQRMIAEASETMTGISRELEILTVYPEIKPQEAITPSDAFMAAMKANRHLNLLLEKQFSSDRVFTAVNLAISYASNMLAEYPGTNRIPQKATYEKNKRPVDVYRSLHKCLLIVMKIYQASDLETLEIDISGLKEKNITPSDVFDIASLIVARLDYFYKTQNNDRIVREPFYPGRKFPSDVYQQATILEQQLIGLLSSIEKKNQQTNVLVKND